MMWCSRTVQEVVRTSPSGDCASASWLSHPGLTLAIHGLGSGVEVSVTHPPAARIGEPAKVAVIPVGSGRRRFLSDLLRYLPAGSGMLLVTGRADLARLWHRELSAYLPQARVGRLRAGAHDGLDGLDVLVATSVSALARSEEVGSASAVVVDEPADMPRRHREALEQATKGRLVELRMQPPAGAGDDQRAPSPPSLGGGVLDGRQVEISRTVAGLLDAQIAARQPARSSAWAAGRLSVSEASLSEVAGMLDGVAWSAFGTGLVHLLPRATVLEDGDGNPRPVWEPAEPGLPDAPGPSSLRAVWPAGGLAAHPVTLVVRANPGEPSCGAASATPGTHQPATPRCFVTSMNRSSNVDRLSIPTVAGSSPSRPAATASTWPRRRWRSATATSSCYRHRSGTTSTATSTGCSLAANSSKRPGSASTAGCCYTAHPALARPTRPRS